MSPTKWINGVNAIGVVTKSGRYGGELLQSERLVILRQLAVNN